MVEALHDGVVELAKGRPWEDVQLVADSKTPL
jgi:hypothetical protein